MKFKNNKVLYRDAFFCTLMTFLVAAVLYVLFINISILDPFEKAFTDFKFTDIFYSNRLNKEERNNKIVLVNIKRADRFEIAQAINAVAAQKPKVIGLDIIFKDRKQTFIDSILKDAFKSNKNLVSAYYHEKDSLVNNHPYFTTQNETKGFINLNLEGQDAVIREFIGVKTEDTIEYAFATQLAIKAGYIDERYARKELNKPIPINYVGNKEVFLNFDIEEVLQRDKIAAMKDAVVIFGYLSSGNPDFDIEDKHFTPLNEKWVGRSRPDTYGVVIHANILNMLAKKSLLYRVSNFSTYAISFLVCYFTMLFVLRLYKKNAFVYDLTEKVLQLLLSVLLLYVALVLLQFDIYINVVPIIFIVILGIEIIDFYEHVVLYLNKKFKWKSTLL